MNKIHYSISDAAKELHVESHVLRYWEDELHLYIPRNQMGHRIYNENEIHLLKQIIQWKEQGLSLKEIEYKCKLSGFCKSREDAQETNVTTLQETSPKPQVIPYPNEEKLPEDSEKMQQFKQILGRIVSDAMQENTENISASVAASVSDHVNKELDFLFREKEEADEKHFRQLDETLRSLQKARQEAAAANEAALKKKKDKKHFFGKRK